MVFVPSMSWGSSMMTMGRVALMRSQGFVLPSRSFWMRLLPVLLKASLFMIRMERSPVPMKLLRRFPMFLELYTMVRVLMSRPS